MWDIIMMVESSMLKGTYTESKFQSSTQCNWFQALKNWAKSILNSEATKSLFKTCRNQRLQLAQGIKTGQVPSMQGWRSSPVSKLSSRRIMVLMASFALSQSVLRSIYSACASIRIQK